MKYIAPLMIVLTLIACESKEAREDREAKQRLDSLVAESESKKKFENSLDSLIQTELNTGNKMMSAPLDFKLGMSQWEYNNAVQDLMKRGELKEGGGFELGMYHCEMRNPKYNNGKIYQHLFLILNSQNTVSPQADHIASLFRDKYNLPDLDWKANDGKYSYHWLTGNWHLEVEDTDFGVFVTYTDESNKPLKTENKMSDNEKI
jgi:hypothetical protein